MKPLFFIINDSGQKTKRFGTKNEFSGLLCLKPSFVLFVNRYKHSVFSKDYSECTISSPVFLEVAMYIEK